jgi:hypothetical protein
MVTAMIAACVNARGRAATAERTWALAQRKSPPAV